MVVEMEETGEEISQGPKGGWPPDRGRQALITDFLKPQVREKEGESLPEHPMNEPFSAEQDVAEEGLPKVPAGDEGRRSYSSVVGRALPDVDSLPDPIHAGTDTKIIVPQDAYEERLQGFRFALIGRANFKFISMDDIRKEARETWNLKGGVKMAPMGKGYILFKFEKEGDMAALWRRSLTRVTGHVLRFQRWKPDFDVHAKNINTKLVWIRFPDLPLEYWHEKILLTMAKAAGRPVALDRCTRAASMGSFARVQVEIEMGASRPEEIQVERRQPGTGEIFWFKQIISYEDGMLRCGYCKRMGHNVQSCRHRKAPNREVQHREGHIDGETFGEEEGGRQDEGP
ncbi:uncharacterized protein LOC122067766 [Macadamia integrifolia]|uniref:uncharacterized protein LOC122067766 n=1 Tax=Macadamia integrifolia TaxID=60698 RepID=UPI001C4F835E|nr:uncharacterized protein LOC122067766 [Macadamia integrifolia]